MGQDTWTAGPNLLTARQTHSCVGHPSDQNVIFVIGGYNNGYLQTIEKITFGITANDNSNTSVFIQGELSVGLTRTRSVVYQNQIYIIGGLNNGVRDGAFFHILNPDTEDV